VISKENLRAVFAEALRRERKHLGLSQEDLAELSGLHRTYVGAVERAERNVSIDNIEKLSKAVRKDAASLLTP